MMARLLLVGLVGVLGISLPDGTDLGQSRTYARTGAPIGVVRRVAVVTEPIPVDDSINRIADELNRQSEGLDLPMVSTARVVAIAAPASDESIDAVDRMFAENEVWGHPAPEPVSIDAVDRMFAENEVWGNPVPEPVASSPPPSRESPPAFEPIATVEGATSVVDELNRASEGIDLEPSVVVSQAPRWPSFEPIAVADSSTDVADALNRASEGVSVAPVAERSFGQALRLTHDAALAWLKILTKTIPTDTLH